tara:strand:- start:3118 stop:4284 length:1167 start_codon:yes stop_codon:yes gene_type:complete
MQRILIVDNSRPTQNGGIGGSLNSMIQLINRINKNKFKIFVLLYYKLPMLESEFQKMKITPIYKNNFLPKAVNSVKRKFKNSLYFLPFYSDLFVIKNFKQINYLANIIKKNKIDIVHGNSRLTANIFPLLAAKKCKVKYVQHQRKFEDHLGLIVNYSKSYTSCYFAISDEIKKNIVNTLKIPDSKVELVHNWINPNNQNIKNTTTNNLFKILWLGRIVPWKGIDILINIANEMKKNNFEYFEIDIYGDYLDLDYKKYLLDMIDSQNLKDIISFKGFKKFKEIDIDNYSVYIHTSKEPEPFGRTIIESMKAGLPVCATNMGGVLDIITHNKNGFLYDCNKPFQLISFLNRLNKDKFFSNELILNAQKTVKDKFSGDHQIKLIEKIYKGI